jgi:hypothetical protein
MPLGQFPQGGFGFRGGARHANSVHPGPGYQVKSLGVLDGATSFDRSTVGTGARARKPFPCRSFGSVSRPFGAMPPAFTRYRDTGSGSASVAWARHAKFGRQIERRDGQTVDAVHRADLLDVVDGLRVSMSRVQTVASPRLGR